MMRALIIVFTLAASTPGWALAPQTAMPRPFACSSSMVRVAASDRPDQRCPQWLSTGGIISKRSVHRG